MYSKTSVSKASTYQEIGEFWDEHDATEFGEQIDVEFKVNIQSQRRYYPIDNCLAIKIKQFAQERSVSESTLLNQRIQEKISQTEDELKVSTQYFMVILGVQCLYALSRFSGCNP